MSNLKKNISYNIIYQILNLIIPLITTPYIARTIGVDGVGIYSYTYAIVQYFMLFIMLGLNNYGNRTIAKCKNDEKILQKNFWNIYTVQIISFVIISIVYIIYIIFIASEFKLIFAIQFLFILSAGIDINWLFYGLEKFKLTITRNAIIKFTLMILIFIFVKNSKGIYLYTVFMALASLLSNVVLWLFVFKNVRFAKPNKNDIIYHFKKNIILFIPVVAISIYNVMDKIMIGQMLNVTEVGLYENAEKIINVPLNILTALGTVMLPRTANLIATNQENKVIEYINKTMKMLLFIALPIIVGIYITADKFVVMYLGNEFEGSVILVKYLSIIILFKIWANIIRTQYLIPKEKDKSYIISVLIGAAFNFIFNIAFIKKYGTIGAVYGTIIAEFSVCLIQTIVVIKELPVKEYLIQLLKCSFFSVLMGGILLIIKNILYKYTINAYIELLVLIFLGVLIYSILNLKYIIDLFKSIILRQAIKK